MVTRTIDDLLDGGFLKNLDDTEQVVAAVIGRLCSRLVSDASWWLTRGSVLFDLQQRDLDAGRDTTARLVREGDSKLIEDALRNADDYLHDGYPDR